MPSDEEDDDIVFGVPRSLTAAELARRRAEPRLVWNTSNTSAFYQAVFAQAERAVQPSPQPPWPPLGVQRMPPPVERRVPLDAPGSLAFASPTVVPNGHDLHDHLVCGYCHSGARDVSFSRYQSDQRHRVTDELRDSAGRSVNWREASSRYVVALHAPLCNDHGLCDTCGCIMSNGEMRMCCHSCTNCCACYTCVNCSRHGTERTNPQRLQRIAALRSVPPAQIMVGGCSNAACRRCPSCITRYTGHAGSLAGHNLNCPVGRRVASPNDPSLYPVPRHQPRMEPGEVLLLTPTMAQRKRNRMQREMSVEVEHYYRNGKGAQQVLEWAKKWKAAIVADGSLASTGYNGELNSRPAGGDLFLDQMKEMTDALKLAEAYVDKTCGLHVHVNAQDMRWWDMRRLVLLYGKVEGALFRIVDPERKDSSFSVPCADSWAMAFNKLRAKGPTFTGDLKKAMMTEAYGSEKIAREQKLQKYPNGQGRAGSSLRYRALNVHSWMYRGSLEFRHSQGSVDYDYITNWSLLVGSVVDAANRMSDAEVAKLATGFPTLKLITPTKVYDWAATRAGEMSKVAVPKLPGKKATSRTGARVNYGVTLTLDNSIVVEGDTRLSMGVDRNDVLGMRFLRHSYLPERQRTANTRALRAGQPLPYPYYDHDGNERLVR